MKRIDINRLLNPQGLLVLLAMLWTPTFLQAQAVNLSTWTVESGPAFETLVFDEAAWQVSPDQLTVTQLENPNPTFFYSDFRVESARVRAELSVNSATPQDDDFIGLAIGFDPGESRDVDADYLLLDWKQRDQILFGGLATEGLAVSRVQGIATLKELLLHEDDAQNPDGGVVELARGLTLGNTGWEVDRTYSIELEILPTQLRVFVDGALEIELAGVFDRGRIACYNLSQPLMNCGNFTVEPLPVQPVLSLDGFNDESYRFGLEAPGSWRLATDGNSAEQLNRNDASVFYSDFILTSDVVSAELISVDNSEDDFMGFVLGFEPGATQDPGAEYILVDWKKVSQSGQFGGASFTADAGLSVSRVFGVPNLVELAGHQDLPTTVGGVVELARATNLGGVGWDTGSRYVFTFQTSPTSLQIWVEDTTRGTGPQLEFDLAGDFSAIAGRFGCFSNSQPRVECGNVRQVVVND